MKSKGYETVAEANVGEGIKDDDPRNVISVLVRRRRENSSLVPLIRTIILSDQGPTSVTSFNLDYFYKGPIFRYTLEVRVSSYKLWGNTNIQSITES